MFYDRKPFPLGFAKRAGASAPPRRRSYILRHWRGELPLALSCGANVVLVCAASLALAAAMAAAIDEARDPRVVFGIGLALMLGITVVPVWQVVGVWRSAGCYRARGGRRSWAITARLLMVLYALQSIRLLLTAAVPELPVLWAMATGERELEQALYLLDDGSGLAFDGDIGFGLTGEIRALLDAHPEIRVLRLSSIGGNLLEALRLHDFIRRRGLATDVATLCASACVVAFMGGEQRLIGPEAKLGFHQTNVPPAERAQQNRRDIDRLIADGVDRAFAERAYATPNEDMWYPTADELLRAHVITGIRSGRKGAL